MYVYVLVCVQSLDYAPELVPFCFRFFFFSQPHPIPHTPGPTTNNSPSQAALVGKFDPQTEMEKAVHDLLVHARADKEAAVSVVCV